MPINASLLIPLLHLQDCGAPQRGFLGRIPEDIDPASIGTAERFATGGGNAFLLVYALPATESPVRRRHEGTPLRGHGRLTRHRCARIGFGGV